jgi:hypothetical protein
VSEHVWRGARMETSRRRKLLTLGTMLLVVGASFGFMSAAIIEAIVPVFKVAHTYFRSYQGYLSVNYEGIYRYVTAISTCNTGFTSCAESNQTVFYLTTKNATIQLIFYCGNYYCDSPSQLPFSDGTCLHVKGTLIEPSMWPSDQFSPSMHFDGDLYVFENQTLPKTSCS